MHRWSLSEATRKDRLKRQVYALRAMRCEYSPPLPRFTLSTPDTAPIPPLLVLSDDFRCNPAANGLGGVNEELTTDLHDKGKGVSDGWRVERGRGKGGKETNRRSRDVILHCAESSVLTNRNDFSSRAPFGLCEKDVLHDQRPS